MTQAVVDPEALRHFAGMLGQFVEDIQGSASRLQAAFAQVGETWRDQEHAHFAEVFSQTMQALGRFSQEAQQHIPFLLRKAAAADQYLQTR